MKFSIDTSLIGNPEGNRLLAPGTYHGVIRTMETETYPGRYKGYANPNHAEGKWDYLKIVPYLELESGDDTVTIDRQGLVMGVYHQGELYRPDGRKDLSPLFTSPGSAYYFFRQMGLLESETFEFSTNLFVDAAVKVETFYQGYVRRGWNFTPDELLKEFQMISGEEGGWSALDVQAMVLYWNTQSGYAIVEQPDQGGPDLTHLEVCRHAVDSGSPDYTFEYTADPSDDRPERLRVYNHVTSWAQPDEEFANSKGWVKFGDLYYESVPGAVVGDPDDVPFF